MEFVLNFICDTKEKVEIAVRQTVIPNSIEHMLEHLKKIPRCEIFLNKVGKREAPGYYNIIKNPMDLGTMSKKIHLYRELDEFVADLDLIINNCLTYNTAEYYIECASELKAESDALLMKYRRSIPVEPESFIVNGIEKTDEKEEVRRMIMEYLKRVGFEESEKRCLDILFDVFEHKIKSFINKMNE